MSRSDRRRGGKNKNWNSRDNSEKNERSERNKQELKGNDRSERKHEARGSASYERRQERRHLLNSVNPKELEENRLAIRAFKENIVNCEICGEAITDIATAITNKDSLNPV
ncbi:MAG: hypothetical protein IJ630_03720, partial [Treponema sp.]|nr:hypothetical protein [Treponema sp.]